MLTCTWLVLTVYVFMGVCDLTNGVPHTLTFDNLVMFTSCTLTCIQWCGWHVLLQIHWPQALPRGVTFAELKDEHYLGYSEERIADTWKVNMLHITNDMLICYYREWRNVLLRAWLKALAYPTSPSKRLRTCWRQQKLYQQLIKVNLFTIYRIV